MTSSLRPMKCLMAKTLGSQSLLTRLTKGQGYPKALLGLAVAAALSTTAFASDTQKLAQGLDYAVPEQTLARSLADVAEQAGLSLVITAENFQQRVAALPSGVRVDQALQQLLEDQGYDFEIRDNNQLVLIPLQSSSEEVIQTITVVGTAQSRYEFDEARSATGFLTDIDELPRTIQVLPEQLAQDQNADDLSDLLTNAAGVTRAHGFGGTETQLNIRGFTNGHLFVDGNPVANRYNIDLANVDSAEVILGPASVLHGQVSPGGLVNIVTKKPEEEEAHSLEFDVDSFGKRKMVLDSTGPINDQLLYRVILSGEDSTNFRDVNTVDGTESAKKQTFNISPSFSYTPDDDNTYTLRFNYAQQELPIDRGTVAVPDSSGGLTVADIPNERRLGSEFDKRDSSDFRLQFDWDRELDNDWINRFKFGYYEKNFDDYQARPVSGLSSVPASFEDELAIAGAGLVSSSVQDNGLLVRIYDTNPGVKESDLFLSNSISGDYQIGETTNTLYVGANLNRREIDDADGAALVNTPAPLVAGFGFGSEMYDISVVDINSASSAANTYRNQTLLNSSSETIDEIGLSIQNLAQVTEDFKVLTGLRYDRFDFDKKTTTYYEAISAGNQGFNKLATPEKGRTQMTNDNISAQFGALYDINDSVSVYASYSDSFKPNYPNVVAGVQTVSDVLTPESSRQYEVGVKSSFMDDKVRFSAALYDLQRKDVLKYRNLVSYLNGEERTRGIDLSSSMQFIPGLNILASLSLMDSEIINDGSSGNNNSGKRPYSIPKKKARIWGSYEFQGGDLAGFGIGAGVEYVGQRFGDDRNTIDIPSYAVADTAMWYYIPVGQARAFRVQAGIKNLTDETYFTANGSGGPYRINVGDPRTFYVNLRYEF